MLKNNEHCYYWMNLRHTLTQIGGQNHKYSRKLEAGGEAFFNESTYNNFTHLTFIISDCHRQSHNL
jgi:hypothetical protein